jgi:hypothetical protein
MKKKKILSWVDKKSPIVSILSVRDNVVSYQSNKQ